MNVDGARPIYLANLKGDYVQQGRFWLSLYDGENCPFAMANVKLPVVFLRGGSDLPPSVVSVRCWELLNLYPFTFNIMNS